MANKNITQLSGTSQMSRLALLPIVNSGYTDTYHININDFSSYYPFKYDAAGRYNISPFYYGDNLFGNSVYYSSILGGLSNSILGTGGLSNYNVIVGGFQNAIKPTGDRGYKTIINGYNNIIENNNQWVSILGGRNNTINGGDYGMAIIGAESNTMNNCNYGTGMIGAVSNTFSSVGTSVGAGGYGNQMSNSNDSVSLGGRSNNISNSYNIVGVGQMVCDTQNISGGSNKVASIASSNSTISGKENVVQLATSGRTAENNNTTYGEYIHSYRAFSTKTQDLGTGSTFNVDFNLGGFAKVAMSANTSLDFSGLRDGGTYRMLVENLSNYTITAATATGYTIKCEGAALPNITNTGIDLCILEVFGTIIYVRHFANFATP